MAATRRWRVGKAVDWSMDPAGGPWVCICTVHSTVCNFETRAEARSHRPLGDWCEACMAEQEPYPSFKDQHGRDPVAGTDFDPDAPLCQDDAEYFGGYGRYGKRAT